MQKSLRSSAMYLCSFLALSMFTVAAEKSPLAEYAGVWTPKPDLCGKEPKFDNEFPYEISKNGLEVGHYEDSCDVVKARKIAKGTYSVRLSCEAEGQPYLETRIFKFSSGTLSIDGGRKFYNCKKGEATKARDLDKVVRGRCHQDVCGFFQVGRVIEKRKTRSGVLIVSEYRTALVDAPFIAGQEEQYSNVKVPSFSKIKPNLILMHCSKQRPFSASKMSNGKWFGELLNLPTYTSSARANTTSLYWAICHNLFIGADQIGDNDEAIQKLGYDWQWPSDSDQLEFETMDDMIVFAKR